jgi:ABC-2 type transport system ATP-binding protein
LILRPKVLLLDEPVAALDPLARREFLGSLAGAMAEQELTVVLSSHLLPDLERICDHLIVLSAGRPVLCAGIDELLASHRRLRAAARKTAAIAGRHQIIQRTRTPREVTMTVRLRGSVLDPAWEVSEVGLEEIVLAYLAQGAPPPPEAIELAGQKPADAPGGVAR